MVRPMPVMSQLAGALTYDPILSILVWVVGAAAMALVVSDNPKANTAAIVTLSVLWWAIVPVLVVAHAMRLLVGDSKPESNKG